MKSCRAAPISILWWSCRPSSDKDHAAHPSYVIPNLTAQENVEFIAELVDNPMPVAEAIAKVKLTDRANNYPGQMSGGQQRVSIARAIVKRPKLILADEPTAALDYTTSIEVFSVIEDIVKNQSTTVFALIINMLVLRKVRNLRLTDVN